MIPLLHDFTGATVLVVGGGSVGARKARRFAREAEVIVLGPDFGDREFGDSELVRAAPDPGEIRAWVERTEPALVVAATDDEAVNDAAAEAARDRGALVNRADRSGSREADSVVVPATVRDDPVVVAVATGGASPALSRQLRKDIEADLAGAGAMAELTGELRTELKALEDDPAARRRAIRAVVQSSRVWKALRTGDTNGRQVARDVINEELGEGPGETSC
ncbi:precorrin-2 dehydrogenase / sirohydrochlorin ferrochelatase [Natronoarchaeum philippinense]|uniref:precorrin-2 dehydrogenase n=1 Tax=Natronoarchaeum philippinense TaxID=558529 RepID=A0A285NAY9_NATPI|nr:NAD(P)-dependent oxidoreductase [Natronoarchaeum philippinense]SNZ06589.1 precorrin-2 dehydrogenase / sirohydrochlorin ferrochelatase [Natronoarchaeum philippinense]